MHSSAVKQLAFNADGSLLASLGEQNDIKIWDVYQQTFLAEIVLSRHSQANCLTFGPQDADWALAVGLESGEVLYIDLDWHVKSVQAVQAGCPITELLVSGDDNGLLVMGNHILTVLHSNDLQSLNQYYLTWHNGDHLCSQHPGEDNLVAKGCSVGFCCLATAYDSHLFAYAAGAITYEPNISPRPQTRVLGISHQIVRLRPSDFDEASGRSISDPCNPVFVQNVERLINGTVRYHDEFRLIDYESSPYMYPLKSISSGGSTETIEVLESEWLAFEKSRLRSAFDLSFTPAGDYLASAHDDGILRVWQMDLTFSANNLVAREVFDAPLMAVAFSPNGERVAVVEADSNLLRVHVVGTKGLPSPCQIHWHVQRVQQRGSVDLEFVDELVIERPWRRPRFLEITIQEKLLVGAWGRETRLYWSGDGKSLFLYSRRSGTAYHINLKSQRLTNIESPEGGAVPSQAVTAFACSSGSSHFATGDGVGTVRLRKQAAPTADLPLVGKSVVANILMPEVATFPPPWVHTPHGTLTLKSAISGRELARDNRANAWWTTISQDHVYITTGLGEFLIIDLEGVSDPRVLRSPLGPFGQDTSQFSGNSLEYMVSSACIARLEPSATGKPGHYQAFKEQRAYYALSDGLGPFVNTLVCEELGVVLLAGGTTKAVFWMDLATGQAEELFSYAPGVGCRLQLATNAKQALAWWIESNHAPGEVHELDDDACPSDVKTHIVLVDLASRGILIRWCVEGLCSSLDISRDGSVVAGVWGHRARVFETKVGAQVDAVDLTVKIRVPFFGEPWAPDTKWPDVDLHRWYFPKAALSPDGEQVYIYDESENLWIYSWRTRTASVVDWVLPWQVNIRQAGHGGGCLVSPTGRYIAFSGHASNLRLLDRESGGITGLLGHLGLAYPSCFSADERLLITSGGDDGLRVWTVENPKLLLEFRMFNVNDWVARAPDGRWDATPEGLRRARLVSGTTQASFLGTSKYWTPGLVEAILSGEDRPIGSVESFSADQREAPLISASGPQQVSGRAASLEIEIECRGRQATALFAFVNGRLVKREDLDNLTAYGRHLVSIEVPLAGESNLIDLIAGTASMAQSQPCRHVVQRIGSPKPRLIAVCVGVNGHDLHYAASDALAMAKALKDQPQALYRGVTLKLVLNRRATKHAVSEAISEVIKTANPEDAFIFYFAGHGQVYEIEGRREASLLPIDALDQSPGSVVAISIDDVRRWMTQVPAQQQLWILDSCGSGTVSTSLGELAFSENLRRLAFEVSCHIIAGAAVGGVERTDEQHALAGGVLTYAILEKLRNVERGGFVTFSELSDHVKKRVRELTDGLREPLILSPVSNAASPFRVGRKENLVSFVQRARSRNQATTPVKGT